jgi:aspartate carbamoyltransferase catalytic subunit
VVLRDSDEQSVYEMLESLRIPIINAGNGTDEHPTQALADIYALLKWKPGFFCKPDIDPSDKVRIGIVGVPGRMRTVRSLLTMLGLFSHAISELVLISDEEDPFSDGQHAELESAGLNIRLATSLDAELPGLDVVYINTIAWVGDDYEELGSRYKLDR